MLYSFFLWLMMDAVRRALEHLPQIAALDHEILETTIANSTTNVTLVVQQVRLDHFPALRCTLSSQHRGKARDAHVYSVGCCCGLSSDAKEWWGRTLWRSGVASCRFGLGGFCWLNTVPSTFSHYKREVLTTPRTQARVPFGFDEVSMHCVGAMSGRTDGPFFRLDRLCRSDDVFFSCCCTLLFHQWHIRCWSHVRHSETMAP